MKKQFLFIGVMLFSLASQALRFSEQVGHYQVIGCGGAIIGVAPRFCDYTSLSISTEAEGALVRFEFSAKEKSPLVFKIAMDEQQTEHVLVDSISSSKLTLNSRDQGIESSLVFEDLGERKNLSLSSMGPGSIYEFEILLKKNKF